MHKGVSKLQNIQLLKWCAEYGVIPLWNIIWGFPGETPEDYQEMSELIPQLTHLRPPLGLSTIRLDRFSPNFDYAERFGFANVRPFPSSYYIYASLPDKSIRRLTYFFTFDYAEPRDVVRYTAPVTQRVTEWRRVHEKGALFFIDKGDAIVVCDTRPAAKQTLTALQGAQMHLYILCDKAQGLRQLQNQLRENFETVLPESTIERLLESLVDLGLMVREKNAYLSLAIPVGDYTPPKKILEHLGASLNSPLMPTNALVHPQKEPLGPFPHSF